MSNHIRTEELVPFRTWISWNGMPCLILAVNSSAERPGLKSVTLARYNSSGTKISTNTMDAAPRAVWTPRPTPRMFS